MSRFVGLSRKIHLIRFARLAQAHAAVVRYLVVVSHTPNTSKWRTNSCVV